MKVDSKFWFVNLKVLFYWYSSLVFHWGVWLVSGVALINLAPVGSKAVGKISHE